VALDRICFFESYTSFGIAPWNPGAGLSFVLILVFGWHLFHCCSSPPYWRISSIDKFTLLEEGGRIPFSIVFAAKARTGVDHAGLDKFVVNRLRFSASAYRFCRSIVEAHGAYYGLMHFREGHRYASHYR
jgi:hypothetical protein